MHLERLVIASLIVSGCRGEAYDAPPPTQIGSLAAAVQAAHYRMHARFAAARRMEESLAHSDLDAAHVEAHLLTELDEPDALPAWQPYIGNIRTAAHQVELATSLGAAARLTAMLGRSCARCHEAIKAHVTFPTEPRPSNVPRMQGQVQEQMQGQRQGKTQGQMQGHQWAAVQMWEGLIGPSYARWKAGAQALTTVPLDMIAMRATPTADADIDDVSRVRLYAWRALAAQAEDARAEVFGQLLATCAHCHATLRDR